MKTVAALFFLLFFAGLSLEAQAQLQSQSEAQLQAQAQALLQSQSSSRSQSQTQAQSQTEELYALAETRSSLYAYNPQLALSSPDYRVTAGDIYTLAYAAGNTAVTYPIAVDNTYRIRVSNLGVINATGKTFQQLKGEVEAIVINNYPLSGVQFSLTMPATFKIYIAGEVVTAKEEVAWALARLSSVVTRETITEYSSIRDITITSLDRRTQTYDLFKAQRFGDLSQDPYLRPEDVITLNRVDRQVSIQGEIEREGLFQLLPEENLAELINYYASGFTADADVTRIELIRFRDSNRDSGIKLFLNEQSLADNFALLDRDQLFIPSKEDLRPVVFVEGAVQVSDDSDLTTSNRLIIRFNYGENYAALVQRNATWFSAISDTQNAYILRNNAKLPINLNPILYDSAYRSSYTVEENDVLVIPFRQYFVTVSGAVEYPGRYPYVPDRTWDYYIGLAGGFIPARNSRDAVDIIDIAGNAMTKRDVIQPETLITARSNGALFYFNQVAPVITTILTIVSTTLSILAITGALN